MATKDPFQLKCFSENVSVWDTSLLQLGNSVDVMDCLHVSVSNCELHFVFLSTILYFPYSVPWSWLGVLSQNTRRCQGKFSHWWKSCQA